MSNLVVIEFDNQVTAFEMRAELAKMEKEYLIEMDDVVVVTKDEKGKIKLHQAIDLTLTGAARGSVWGLLIGMIFLNPLLGTIVGTGAGALAGKFTDIGISNDFMKELAADLTEGTSALFVLVRHLSGDKFLERLKEKGFKGKVLQTSLSDEAEDNLRKALEAS
jgi:uncharacterized membrane protein